MSGIALENRDDRLRADLEPAADEGVFRRAGGCAEIEVDVGAEPPLIQRLADFAAERADRLGRDDRDRAAIGHGAIGSEQRQFARPIRLAEVFAQRRIVDREKSAVRRLASR